MIRDIIENITASKNTKETYGARFSRFFILIRLFVLSKLFRRKNKKARVSFLGFKVLGYSYYSLYFLFKEVFISNEYYFTTSTPSPLIIDCGANLGMAVLYFKKLYPSARIIAFEANKHIYQLLEENVKANNLNDIELHNVALYDTETEISFFIDNNIGTLLGSVRETRGGSTEMKVKTRRLSSYLMHVDAVDLIKIDIEGAEIEVLNDLFNTAVINKSKEYIIEYHHNIGNDKSVLSSFLQKFEVNGFNYTIKADSSGENRFQDILIHLYKTASAS
jgi:FkbM family methyltransferase